MKNCSTTILFPTSPKVYNSPECRILKIELTEGNLKLQFCKPFNNLTMLCINGKKITILWRVIYILWKKKKKERNLFLFFGILNIFNLRAKASSNIPLFCWQNDFNVSLLNEDNTLLVKWFQQFTEIVLQVFLCF